ncbi:hypothetical protein ACE193_23610 [Bernardetia sp. OM2101]|uniref:hypothetical protein n=1 Tax=Bernardetia sp. OM2101 TaxID=3344876 RepID=UPI0035CF04D1
METTKATDNFVNAQQINVSVRIKTPKVSRQKSYQVVSFLNEEGEIIQQLKTALSMTALNSLIRTDAGQEIEPKSKGKYFLYDLTRSVEVSNEREKEYINKNKKVN